MWLRRDEAEELVDPGEEQDEDPDPAETLEDDLIVLVIFSSRNKSVLREISQFFETFTKVVRPALSMM
jgi:hypothetical protein